MRNVPPRQRDLFDDEADLFDDDRPTPVHRADPDKVRQELHQILAEARAAQTIPWSTHQTQLHQTIFPQMANWLPDDEAAQLRAEFAAELARLGV
jgi:tRNA nucleotidyltransferase/poly(A) polymerase